MHEINLHLGELLGLPRDCWRKIGIMKRAFERGETHETENSRDYSEVVEGSAARDFRYSLMKD